MEERSADLSLLYENHGQKGQRSQGGLSLKNREIHGEFMSPTHGQIMLKHRTGEDCSLCKWS